MKALAIFSSVALLFASASVQAQEAVPTSPQVESTQTEPAQASASWSPPPQSERCPSKWGADDRRGSANHMGPESVLRAARLIETGKVIELGHVLSSDMPFFGTRRFDVHTKRTFFPNEPSNRRGGNEEIVITEIGHVGTQLDGFTHQTHEDSLYNCLKVSDLASRSGFTDLGIENVGTLMTRGILIDVAGLKGVPTLSDSYEITAQDLQEALEKQDLSLQPGDAVLINTGWGKLWGEDNERFVASAPGIGVEAAQWLMSQDPMLLGSDNWAIEVSPNPDSELSLPVHQIALVVNGVYLLENLKLDELADQGVSEFAFVLQPLKVQGGTGSTVSPTAIR